MRLLDYKLPLLLILSIFPEFFALAQDYLDDGLYYYNRGLYYTAAGSFKRAIEDNPQNYRAHFYLANCYMKISEEERNSPTLIRKAIDEYLLALKIYPDFEDALFYLGIAYFKINDFHNASKCFDKVIQLNPKEIAAYYNIGLCFYNLKDFKKAKYYLEKYLVNKKKSDEYTENARALLKKISGENFNNVENEISLGSENIAYPLDYIYMNNITSYFNEDRGRYRKHLGVDIKAPAGALVYAIADGVVTWAWHDGGYGLKVMIDHGSLVTVYAHLSEISVNYGQKVRKGQVIGKVGDTGNATGSHLHFEVIKDGKYVDPLNFLGLR
ncbi:TPR repeat-containing protein [Candidatus Kryptobacter tengchongensis]|nr:TPR repeat-containing protein [Candidatus Kryptobacter tengchongensis]